MKDIGSTEVQEVAKEGNVASSGRSTVSGAVREGAVREGVESNGGVGLGDSVNVGGGGWGFEGTIGEQNSDGELVGILVEDELTQLHHGHQMTHACGWE